MTSANELPAPISRLAGRAAVVTGASRGIGLAIAHRLVDEGAHVLITARKADALAEAAAQFPDNRIAFVAGKADDPEHRKEVLDTVAERFGRLDILVNNAGINPSYGPLTALDPVAARKIMDVNVLGALEWVQAAIADTRLGFGEHGSVVNIASVAGVVPAPGIAYYGVSKAALSHLTASLAVELGPHVRVNAVAPGVVKTQFARALYEGKEDEVAAQYPMKRLGVPEDVAGAVAFFASDDAAWITGQTLVVDGGLIQAGGTA